MDLTDIYRRVSLNAKEYPFYSAAFENFYTIDHMLEHKANLNKNRKT